MFPRRRTSALILGLSLAALSIAPAPDEAPPLQAPDLAPLLDARYKAALKQFEETWAYYKQARTDALPVYVWSHFVLESQFDLSDKKEDRIVALEGHLDRMRKLEALVKKVRRLGFGQSIEVGATEYYRLEAEYWLAHAQAVDQVPPKPQPLPAPPAPPQQPGQPPSPPRTEPR